MLGLSTDYNLFADAGNLLEGDDAHTGMIRLRDYDSIKLPLLLSIEDVGRCAIMH